MKTILTAILLCGGAHVALAQATSAAPPTAPSNQISPQVLAAMLRSATTFNELVRNLNQTMGPDVHATGANGVPQHSIERTAQTIGAGAGAGAAIGAMTHSQNGVLIGALVGGAGGLIIDEILKHREQTHPHPDASPTPDPAPVQR